MIFQDTYDIIDWSNWTFDDGIFSKKTCIQERNGSCFEGIVDSLNFNGIPSASNHSVMHLKDISLAQLRGEEGSSVLWTSVSPIVVDKEVTAYDPLANIEKVRLQLKINYNRISCVWFDLCTLLTALSKCFARRENLVYMVMSAISAHILSSKIPFRGKGDLLHFFFPEFQ